jgi:hypothetical protein
MAEGELGFEVEFGYGAIESGQTKENIAAVVGGAACSCSSIDFKTECMELIRSELP